MRSRGTRIGPIRLAIATVLAAGLGGSPTPAPAGAAPAGWAIARGQAPQASATPSPPLVEAARSQVGVTLVYDGSYRRLAYPGGDVPLARGVCTDVVVRAYRALGVDLQVLVHEDIGKSWGDYPRFKGCDGPDANIDHRRVPNLRVYFGRHGAALAASQQPTEYLPGDLVTWRLPAGPHIGIVSDQRSAEGVPLVLHNVGAGAAEEDFLFAYPITGHYRYRVGEAPSPRAPSSRPAT